MSKNLLNKIKEGGWGKEVFKEVKKRQLEKEDDLENIIHKSINEHGLDKDKTKNQFRKTIFVVPVIILLALIVAKTLAVKGNSNPGVPNNNKDDEKVNPSIEPEKDKDDEKMNPSTDPESDEQNPEQKKQEQGSQEQKPSVVPNNILKVRASSSILYL